MAANQVGINIGTATSIASDLIGTVNYGISKIDVSPIGASGTLFNGTVGVSALPNIPGGTINAGTVQISGGTVSVNELSGTINLGTITGNVGMSSGTLNVATISTLPNLPQGSINMTAGTVSAGTINVATVTGGTLTNLISGTINSATVTGNLGTIGTVGLATVSGNLGTLGTVGLATVQMTSGTLNVATISTLPNLPQGSINVTAGTIGTVTGVGTVTNIGQMYNAGTLQAGTVSLGSVVKSVAAPTAGSFTAAGSVVQAGSQFDIASFDLQGTYVGTVFFEAQIGTSAWFAVPAFSNTGVIGTQTTGTADYFVSAAGLDGVRARLTYSSGTLTYNSRTANFYNPTSILMGGTVGNIGSVTNVGVLNAGTISSLPNLPQGSINITAGTVSAGTINTGTVNAGTVNVATITAGTLTNLISGTINAATAVLNNGTINLATVQMTSGTLNVATISTLPNLPQGSINVTAGTISAGTINTGTINVGTINVATVTAGTINLGTFVGKDANTIVQTGNPIAIAGTNVGGSVITLNVDSSGNLKTTGIANGTTVGTINIGTINTGTINTGTVNAGTINVATVTAGTVTALQNGTVIKQSPAPLAGSFTAAGSIVQAGSQYDAASFDLQGTWVGTVFFEAQIGTSSWFAIPAYTPTGVIGTQTTGNGDFFVSAAALDGVRARLTYSSGTMTYNSRASNFFAPYTYNMGGTIGNIGTVNVATVTTNADSSNAGGAPSRGLMAAGYDGAAARFISTDTTGKILNVMTAGTVTVGTFRPDARTTQNMIGYGTQIANSGAAAATVVGSTSVGAGTSLWLNFVSIVNPAGTTLCVLGFGTAQQGTNVFWRGVLGTQTVGGVIVPIPRASNLGMTNQDLVFSTGGAGTVDLSFNYFISA